jgi:hypothetical protein
MMLCIGGLASSSSCFSMIAARPRRTTRSFAAV